MDLSDLNKLSKRFRVDWGHKHCHPETCTCHNYLVYSLNRQGKLIDATPVLGTDSVNEVLEFIRENDLDYAGCSKLPRYKSFKDKHFVRVTSLKEDLKVGEYVEGHKNGIRFKSHDPIIRVFIASGDLTLETEHTVYLMSLKGVNKNDHI